MSGFREAMRQKIYAEFADGTPFGPTTFHALADEMGVCRSASNDCLVTMDRKNLVRRLDPSKAVYVVVPDNLHLLATPKKIQTNIHARKSEELAALMIAGNALQSALDAMTRARLSI